jgi:hypothetical protein
VGGVIPPPRGRIGNQRLFPDVCTNRENGFVAANNRCAAAGAKHCKNISFVNGMKRERGKHRKQRSKRGSLPENSGV